MLDHEIYDTKQFCLELAKEKTSSLASKGHENDFHASFVHIRRYGCGSGNVCLDSVPCSTDSGLSIANFTSSRFRR